MHQLVCESDWLGSEPYFYNKETCTHGNRFSDAISSVSSPRLHPEGVYNYFDFGYSVFGQTPLCGVRFLRYASRLLLDESGKLIVSRLDDPFDSYSSFALSETEIIELIRERVRAWEASIPDDQEIVIPLSSGLDSRLLLWCLKDKARVRTFTYGISNDQKSSIEVVYAREVARRVGVRWQSIQLGNFHKYIPDWIEDFGASTHAHGMYHYEFYEKISKIVSGKGVVLSGILGDAFAGSIPELKIDRPEKLSELGYTHGVRISPESLGIRASHEIRDAFWHENRERLRDTRMQVVTLARFKMILLSYLLRVPRRFNMSSWTPYLDIDIASAMLNLPAERRLGRLWQREFFDREGLDPNKWRLSASKNNSLDYQGLVNQPLTPLSVTVLDKVIPQKFVKSINSKVHLGPVKKLLLKYSKYKKVKKLLGVLNIRYDNVMIAYNAYVCIRPIQDILNYKENRR